MRFTFERDHILLAEGVREFLAKECTPADVRASWESETGRSPERWRKLAELGVIGLTAPQTAGGLGLDELALVLILEETGRAALPEPVIEHVGVAVPLLASAAPVGRLAARWLGPAASGEAIVSVGFEGQPFVADAHVADMLLLEKGGHLHLVAPADCDITAQPSVDRSRRLFSVEWAHGAGTPMFPGDRALAYDRGVLGASAQLLGVARQLIDMTAAYARERRQFGQPIGSFQAVKHHLANALLALELARPVVYRAAWSVARTTPTRSVDVSMAKAYASDAANLAARVALQVHGAIGYTWECDAHLWMKRAWALGSAWGDAASHRRRVAVAALGPA